MILKELNALDDSKLLAVITPVKREKKVFENPLIIGFDVKSCASGGVERLLSIQFHTEAHSEVYFPNSRITQTSSISEKLTESDLADYLFLFLSDLKIDSLPKEIFLVTHYAHSELSHFDLSGNIKVKAINKGLCAETTINAPLTGENIKLRIIDLYSLENKVLADFAKYLDRSPIDLNELGGKSGKYWKEKLDLFLESYPEIYRDHALFDAEISYMAYMKLRSHFLEKYELDILNFRTLPSISAYIFKRDYIKESEIVPSRKTREGRKQKKGDKYYSVTQSRDIFDGSKDIRWLALHAYSGGRVETFCRGRIEDERLIYWDVESLYPSSAILQPLPLATTKWVNYESENPETFVKEAEGFVEVEFTFKDGTYYPCLPVAGLHDDILYFPTDGKAFCTLSELRMAIKQGLEDYRIIKGYGFYPTLEEREHPIVRFMKDLLSEKKAQKKGSLEYAIAKNMVNSFVGKLAQRDKNDATLELLAKGEITKEASGVITKSGRGHVGSLWYPEWASLILGKARALMAEFVNKGAYFISTDSVLLPAEADINCDSLDELKSIGSDLKKELEVNHGVIIRARLYALNPLNENPKERHLARHAVSCTPEWFRETMIEGYENRCIPDLTFTSEKAVKYEKSILEGKELNSLESKELSMEIKWDGKRRLFREVENPFGSFSGSAPLSAKEVEKNHMRRPPNEKPGRKAGKKLNTAKKREIRRLREEGMRNKDIAKEVGVSPSWVSKVCKEPIGEGRVDA